MNSRTGKKKFRLKPQAPEGYFTVKQAAEYMGVCEKSVLRYIHNHGLPADKPAGLYLIRRDQLEAWIKQNG